MPLGSFFRNILRTGKRASRTDAEPDENGGGRLGLYKYLDMDDAIAEALEAFEKIRAILK